MPRSLTLLAEANRRSGSCSDDAAGLIKAEAMQHVLNVPDADEN